MEEAWAVVRRYTELLRAHFGNKLKAVAVFGSLARGEAKFPESDIDLLLVLEGARGSIGKRLKMLKSIRKQLEATLEYKAFKQRYGYGPVLCPHVFNVKELQRHPPLLLDLTEDAVILYDSGVLKRELKRLRQRLKELGARRVERGRFWYWILKPDIKPGEVVEL